MNPIRLRPRTTCFRPLTHRSMALPRPTLLRNYASPNQFPLNLPPHMQPQQMYTPPTPRRFMASSFFLGFGACTLLGGAVAYYVLSSAVEMIEEEENGTNEERAHDERLCAEYDAWFERTAPRLSKLKNVVDGDAVDLLEGNYSLMKMLGLPRLAMVVEKAIATEDFRYIQLLVGGHMYTGLVLSHLLFIENPHLEPARDFERITLLMNGLFQLVFCKEHDQNARRFIYSALREMEEVLDDKLIEAMETSIKGIDGGMNPFPGLENLLAKKGWVADGPHGRF